MQVRFEILKEGDTVINVWDSHIAVRKETGEVEIYKFFVDEEGLPRIADDSILVTHGDGIITTTVDESPIEITTF